MSDKKKKKKTEPEEIVRKSLKHSSRFVWGLLVNVVIALVIIKAFSTAFNFTYDVFGDRALNPISSEYVIVDIPADSSTLEIGEALEKNNVIKSKYVFFAKIKIKKYDNKIKAGKYGLSPSMTYEQIFYEICDLKTEEEKLEESTH